MKNVIALAAGMCEGLDLGTNAMAALVTRGCYEMQRVGLSMGGKSETFMGLSGVGDTFGTCFGPLSRNRNLGVRLGRKHGTHITDSHSSATLCAKSNGTMADIRNAACEYERELQARRQAENGRPAPDAPWVGDEAEPIKRKRPASTAYRNKAVIGKCALNAEKRAARVPAAHMAAYEHSGRASAAGVDIESRDNKRKRDQEAALKAAASERGANAQMVHYDRAEMTRRAKLVVMPRLQIGLIDLDTAVTKKKPAVDELIDECEAREIAVPRTRSGGRKTAGKDSQGTKIDKAYYVSLLRAANGGKRYL